MQTIQALSLNDINNLYDNGTAIVQQWSNQYRQYQTREIYLSDLVYIDFHDSLSDFAEAKSEETAPVGSSLSSSIDNFYDNLNADSNNRITDENHYLYNLIEVEAIYPYKNDIHLSSITEHYSMDMFITLLNDSIYEPIETNNEIKSHTFITSIFI